ncbi:class I adenylate-forming enzyme family protein [Ethanoligenens sp.]|uniref:class I adenylate-forming enzyme family protein n=1 Tax=Ethanoligenens sp. TaxID=2099655 RepID=UPI0039ED71CF
MIRRLLLNRENAEKTAVIDGEKTITYGELARKGLALQHYLPQGPANVAVFLPNGGDYISAVFGVFWFGMTAFPLSVQMTVDEVLPFLKQGDVSAIVTSKKFDMMFEDIRANHLPTSCVIYMEDLYPRESEYFPASVDLGPEEPMVLFATSGTTGKPKIVQLSEKNVETSALGYMDRIGIGFPKTGENEIRYTIASPFSTAYSLMILIACLIRSFPLVLLPERFTLDTLYRTIQDHKVTNYEGGAVVPLLMEQTAGRPIPYDLHTVKHFGFGGSKVSGDTIRRLSEAYPWITFSQGYGMTETAPQVSKNVNAKDGKWDSVGSAVKLVKIAIEAGGQITDAPYTEGEIVVKGPNIMLGYYKNEEATHKVLKNGYLYTGDIGYLDENGYLYLCGRKKNMIIVRGFNVYPEEVEACIQNGRLAKDSFVYGETDPLENEILCVDIVPTDPPVGVDKIRAYLRTHLSEYKQPQKIRFVDAIPKGATGKTERTAKGTR